MSSWRRRWPARFDLGGGQVPAISLGSSNKHSPVASTIHQVKNQLEERRAAAAEFADTNIGSRGWGNTRRFDDDELDHQGP